MRDRLRKRKESVWIVRVSSIVRALIKRRGSEERLTENEFLHGRHHSQSECDFILVAL